MIDIASPAARRTIPVTYRDLILVILVVVASADAACWAAGAHAGAGKARMSNVFVVVSTTAIIAVLVLPWLSLKGQESLDKAQRMAKMASSWVAILALVHLTWEFPWVLCHRWIMGAAGQGQLWSYLWWIYAEGGDARYIHPDGNLLAMETGASLLGATALILTYLRHRAGRFTDASLMAIMGLMTCEFYSTVIYIFSESYVHFRDVTGGPANFVIKFGYGNILWLIMPCIVFLWAGRLLIGRR